MNNNWIQKKYDDDAWSQEVQDEYDVVKGALIDYKRLGLVGGVLKKYGEVVAFEIGEPLNDDTFVVHFEKAYADVQGAYPMINKQFVLHECQGYKYVNREEDDIIKHIPVSLVSEMFRIPLLKLFNFVIEQSIKVYLLSLSLTI